MPDNDIQITPRKAPLTSESHDTSVKGTSPSRPKLTIVLIGVLIAIAYWVIFILPGSVSKLDPVPAATETSEAQTTPQTSLTPQSNAELAAPYQQIERDRAQKQAQSALRNFVDLQLELEDMAVTQWGTAAFEHAKEFAASGDKMFIEEKFAGARDNYSAGAENLQTLIARGTALYQAAISDGLSALAEYDPSSAEIAFQQALAIFPAGPEALDGLDRAQTLPEVLSLVATAEKQVESQEFAQALNNYQKAAALDDSYPDIQQRISNSNQQLLDQQFENHLSAGFQSLDANRVNSARKSFQAAGKIKPGNSLVLGAIQQVEQRSELQTIERFRKQAIQHLAVDQYSAAIASYESVLAIDSALQFAKQGLTKAQTLNRLSTGLQAILDDPGHLSSTEKFAEAKTFYTEGQSLARPKSKLAVLVAQVATTLEFYSLPISVKVISDGATEIVIHKVGRLGKFENKTLSLRPGFYTIVGSRDGCRDELKEVHVLPDMEPIDVRCRESI